MNNIENILSRLNNDNLTVDVRKSLMTQIDCYIQMIENVKELNFNLVSEDSYCENEIEMINQIRFNQKSTIDDLKECLEVLKTITVKIEKQLMSNFNFIPGFENLTSEFSKCEQWLIEEMSKKSEDVFDMLDKINDMLPKRKTDPEDDFEDETSDKPETKFTFNDILKVLKHTY